MHMRLTFQVQILSLIRIYCTSDELYDLETILAMPRDIYYLESWLKAK